VLTTINTNNVDEHGRYHAADSAGTRRDPESQVSATVATNIRISTPLSQSVENQYGATFLLTKELLVC